MQFTTIIPSYCVIIALLFLFPVLSAPTPDISILKTVERLFARHDTSGKASPPTSPPSSGLAQTVITAAGGDVPKAGGPAPPKLSSNGVANFQLANFIENVESAWFAQVLQTLSKDPTFTISTTTGLSIQNVVTKVQAQEVVHKATIEGGLSASNGVLIPPCTQVNTVASTSDFLAQAYIITTTSVGAIINIIGSLAMSDPAQSGATASILSVEGRHDAFFRTAGLDFPNTGPFDTPISNTWAYNLMLSFVTPSSRPTLLPIPVLPVMTLTSPTITATAPSSPPTTIQFTVPTTVMLEGKLFVGWVSQGNAQIYTAATVDKDGKGSASVPPGLTGSVFAALTGQETATMVDDLTSATLAGPAIVLMT